MLTFFVMFQGVLQWVCVNLLLAILGISFAVAVFLPLWEQVRRFASVGAIEKALCLAFIVGMVMYGSTKHAPVSVKWDTGLADNGSLITNDTVTVRWTYSGIPAESSVFIDYREAGSTNGWRNLGETPASALVFTQTLANATNYDYWVYSTYVPPVPVHTNGVWVGQAYETRARAGAHAFLILNGKIREHGRTIAPPSAKRKEDE